MDLAITADQVGDMMVRNTVANASVVPDEGMLGVDKPSAAEWGMQGVGLGLSALGIRSSVKASKEAAQLGQLRSEVKALQEADALPQTRGAHEPPNAHPEGKPAVDEAATGKNDGMTME